MGCNQSVGTAPIEPVPQVASTGAPSAATPAPAPASPAAAAPAPAPAAGPAPAKKQTFAYRGKPLVVFVLGGPGCGKGTQCSNIVRDYGFVHLSAGDLLRREEASGTSANAELIRTLIKEGKIVPVEITVALLKAEMELNVSKGRYLFLVDGFPRNENNEEGWHTVMAGYAEIAFCLFFDCSEEVMLERLTIRGKDSGRTDDNIESIKKRFRTFQQDTMPVVRRFEERGQLRTVSAMMSKHEVYDAVQKLFDAEVEARWKSKPLVAVVTGNSNTGLAALKALTTHFGSKVNARAIVRSADKAEVLRKAGLPFTAEAKQLVVGAQYTRPESEPWPEALEGVSSLFIVAPNFTQNRADLANMVIDAARRNGVAHVAVLSVLGASEEKLLFQRQFHAIEKHAAEAGVSFTALRAGYFMDNFLGSREGLTQHHCIYGCTGASKFSPVAVSDVGHAVAAVLVDPVAHAGQVYNLTGPELLSGEDFAKVFAAELGHEVAYQNQELLDFRAALVKSGWPEWQAGGLVELFAFIKNNPEALSVSADVQKLTGQHTTFAQWVAANKASFSKTPEEAAAGVRPLSPKPVQPANLQTTFAFIKPDVVKAGRDAEMLEQIKKKGFEVVAMKKTTLEKAQASLFYAEHVGKPFFEGLVDFMTSGPAVALALRKENAILDWRAALGPTNTQKAKDTAPESLRAQFGTDGTQNAGHGSDSEASAERELGIIFPELLLEKAKAAAANAFNFEQKTAPVQTTFAFIKPDVVKAGRDEEMLEQIKAKGFEVVGQKKLTLERAVAEEFYGEHKGKPFFEGLVEFMTSGPAVALALRKENAILDWRAALGPTNTEKAKEQAPESLRAQFGTDGRQNAGHGSDSEASAARELKLVFPELNL